MQGGLWVRCKGALGGEHLCSNLPLLALHLALSNPSTIRVGKMVTMMMVMMLMSINHQGCEDDDDDKNTISDVRLSQFSL